MKLRNYTILMMTVLLALQLSVLVGQTAMITINMFIREQQNFSTK